MPLSEALQLLSVRTGIELTAAATLSGRIVYIKFDPAHGGDQLSPLAKVVRGKWVDRGDSQHLIPDIERQQSDEKALTELRSRAIRQALKDIEPVAASPTSRAKAEAFLARLEGLRASSPTVPIDAQAFFRGFDVAGGLCRTLLQSIGPEPLLKLKEGEYLVYCTEPSLGEQRLPSAAITAVQDYQEVQQTLVTLLESKRAPPGLEHIWQSVLSSGRAFSNATRAILTLSSSQRSIGARCELFAGEQHLDTGLATVPLKLSEASFAPKSKTIDFESRSVLAKTLFTAGIAGRSHNVTDADLKAADLYGRPEPLSFFIPEIIRSFHPGPIVACLTDGTFSLAINAIQGANATELAKSMQETQLDFELRDNTLLIRPIAPSLIRLQSQFRTAIKRNLLANSKSSQVSIYDTFQYSGIAEEHCGNLSALGRFYPHMLRATGWRLLHPKRVFPSAFRFLATLTQSQVNALEQGRTMGLETVSSVQLRKLLEWAAADTTGSRPFSATGARRLSDESQRTLSFNLGKEGRLFAKYHSPLSAIFPTSALTVEDWRGRLATYAMSAGLSASELAENGMWSYANVDELVFECGPLKGNPISAPFEWSIPSNKQEFGRWMDLPAEVRSAILAPPWTD